MLIDLVARVIFHTEVNLTQVKISGLTCTRPATC